jgi:hypothetical protein
MRRDKSFADDLIVHRGVVSGRVALLLRSAETKPLMPRFVPFRNPQLFISSRPLSVEAIWEELRGVEEGERHAGGGERRMGLR